MPYFQVPEVCVLQAAAVAAKLEGEVSARAEAKASSCARSETTESVKAPGKASEEASAERGFQCDELSLDDLNKVFSSIEKASSHQDDALALSCLKEAQAQARTLLKPERSLGHS